MKTFDGSKPDLVSNKTIKDIEFKLDITSADENGNRVLNGIGTFYNDYILPNMFPIIVILLLAIYLTIKYVIKRDREDKEKDQDIEETTNNVISNLKKNLNKNLMVKVDPEKVINNPSVKPNIEISDMISDDYLLSDTDLSNNTDQEQEQNQEQNDNDNDNPEIFNGLNEIIPNNDINEVTKMVFGDY